MNETTPLLVPSYFHKFSCIGSACEDSCCTGWQIEIDKETYEKYRESQDTELKSLFRNNVEQNTSSSSSANFAKMKMQHGGCSFLSKEHLCTIQMKLGEDFLSNTCAIYPRYINRVNGIVEKSLTMSCPEAARITLLNPNGIEFDQIEELENGRIIITNDLNTNHSKAVNQPIKHFWEFRVFIIQILQDRTYSLDERLLFLGLFLRKVQDTVDNGELTSMEGIITQYKDLFVNEEARFTLSSLPTKLAVQIGTCKELLDHRASEGIGSERYLNCLAETLQGLQYKKKLTIEKITGRYKEALEEYFGPFMKNYGYILENYLVNYVFKTLFPFKSEDIFEDYIMLVIHYSLIKFHLIGMSGYYKGLSTDLAILLIQSFSKSFEHNTAFLKKAFNLLKANGDTTMESLAVLIKN